MFGRGIVLATVFLGLGGSFAEHARAQVRFIAPPPIVMPKPPPITNLRIDTNLGNVHSLPQMPRLDGALPVLQGAPTPQSGFPGTSPVQVRQTPPREQPGNPAVHVKHPSPPGHAAPDGDGPSESGSGRVPAWLIWLGLLILVTLVVRAVRPESAPT